MTTRIRAWRWGLIALVLMTLVAGIWHMCQPATSVGSDTDQEQPISVHSGEGKSLAAAAVAVLAVLWLAGRSRKSATYTSGSIKTDRK
ncbi:MAG: hypothetical protein JXA93_24490 [Anaerolineae bacterium]|nr:hypothetical protein [Anaerolineae bacterium]